MGDQRWAPLAGGLVGAMAMTGVRRLTTELGLLGEPPPDAIARQATLGFVARLPVSETAASELAHWLYGAGGGAVFALLPGWIRRRRFAGPAYGLASWAVFDRVIAPALGLPHADDPPLRERLALAADHALYGAIVAAGAKPGYR